MPFFALNKNEVETGSPFKKLFYRTQWIFIPFALLFNVFNIQRDSWLFLKNNVIRYGFTQKVLLDLFSIFLHYLIWVILALFFINIKDVLFLYFIRAFSISVAMFATFAPAHFPEEAKFLSIKNIDECFIKRQVYSTVNFKTGIVGKYILGGVDFQIEHHLFPNLPQYNYIKVSKLVKDYCLKHNFPYNTISWGSGIWKSLKVFKSPKEVYDSIYG